MSLGATPTATLLSFPAFQVEVPCQNTLTLDHAVYHRFTAPEDGWYSLHAVPVGPSFWRPRLAVLSECNSSQAIIAGYPQWSYPLCDEGDSQWRYHASASFHLQAGQSRIVVVGGETVNDAGQASLRLVRIGSTLMEGAQPLALGGNAFSVAAREPALPYPGACDDWSRDRMGNASRFSFIPPKTGTYRFSFCGSQRNFVAISPSPNLEHSTVTTAQGGCPGGNGGRITAQLQEGIVYYVSAGHAYGNYDACTSLTATVEYVDPCPADFNDDDVTDGVDLGILLAAWGTSARDITGDGTTDGVDLGILLAMWGACPD
jgi:hypothetical protein